MSNETRQAEEVDWDNDFGDGNGGSNSNGNDIPIMDISETGQYRVRLVGAVVVYRKRWTPEVVENHTTCKAYRKEDPFWQAGFYPRKRFAGLVIDRADGKLKILDKGPAVFDGFSDYKKTFNVQPNGKDGPDFIITVNVPMKNGKPNKRRTEYKVQHADKAPFTEEEREMIRANYIDLKTHWRYLPSPLSKIKEIWEKTPADKRVPPKRDDEENKSEPVKAAASAPAQETIPPADDSELFNNSGSVEGETSSGDLF